MSQAPRYMKEIPARFCMFLAIRQFVLDPFKEIHMRFIALWIFFFFFWHGAFRYISHLKIYIYTYMLLYIQVYLHIQSLSKSPQALEVPFVVSHVSTFPRTSLVPQISSACATGLVSCAISIGCNTPKAWTKFLPQQKIGATKKQHPCNV